MPDLRVFLLPIALGTVIPPSTASILVDDARCRELATQAGSRAGRPVADEAGVLLREGVRLACLGRRGDAMRLFQRVITLDPNAAAAYNNLAALLATEGRIEEAGTHLENAIRTSKVHHAAHNNLSAVYLHQSALAYQNALNPNAGRKPPPPTLTLVLPEEAPSASARPETAVERPRPESVGSTGPAPASAVASKPKTTVASSGPDSGGPSAAATGAAPEDVQSAVEAWAAAWSRRDFDAYLAAYSREFAGRAANREAWVTERRDRIVTRKDIKVTLTDLSVKVSGETARAVFAQHYRSDGRDIRSRKRLELARIGGRWLIVEEHSN